MSEEINSKMKSLVEAMIKQDEHTIEVLNAVTDLIKEERNKLNDLEQYVKSIYVQKQKSYIDLSTQTIVTYGDNIIFGE